MCVFETQHAHATWLMVTNKTKELARRGYARAAHAKVTEQENGSSSPSCPVAMPAVMVCPSAIGPTPLGVA